MVEDRPWRSEVPPADGGRSSDTKDNSSSTQEEESWMSRKPRMPKGRQFSLTLELMV